jgi:ornithine cyclodeaminase
LLVVGAGRVAGVVPDAYAAVRQLDRVLIWNRDAAAATKLVADLRSRALPASVATNLEQAVREADIITTATGSKDPLIRGEWLAPHSHLDLIGGYAPDMRESDDACMRDCDLWVDTPEALQKSGDLLQPMQSGAIAASDVKGALEDLCRNRVKPDATGRRTVFKSVGSALEDLAAAILVYESQTPRAR